MIRTVRWDAELGPVRDELHIGTTLCLAQTARGYTKYAVIWNGDEPELYEIDNHVAMAIPDATPEVRGAANEWLYRWGLEQTEEVDQSDLIGRRVTWNTKDGRMWGTCMSAYNDYRGRIRLVVETDNGPAFVRLAQVYFVDRLIRDTPKEIAERVVREGAFWEVWGLAPLGAL